MDNDKEEETKEQDTTKLSNVITLVNSIGKQRPTAPASLSADQTAIWNATVESLPQDWFGDEVLEQLALYCRHSDNAKKAQAAIDLCYESFEVGTFAMGDMSAIDTINKLSTILNRESRTAISLATKLRITKQATVNKKASKEVDKKKKPWEVKS